MAVWEVLVPRRRPALPIARRWPANLALAALDTALVRLVLPAGAVGTAALAAERGWGLFSWIEVPTLGAIAASVLLFDLALYLQHVAFHRVPALWRLHLVHHADLDLDVTTGLRFHPVEIVLSMAIKLALVVLLGPPVAGVVLFEILLSATALFNHGNVRLPTNVDRVLRWWVVTPDMHSVHHSVVFEEYDSNFGSNLPWWDRLFGTYRGEPGAGRERVQIGLALRDPSQLQLGRMLAMPFAAAGRGSPGAGSGHPERRSSSGRS